MRLLRLSLAALLPVALLALVATLTLPGVLRTLDDALADAAEVIG